MAANPAYPTQWALNPTAYQNVDSSDVDWAALAQQWIAMKEAAAIVTAPPPPAFKPEAEEGEAPMEVENTDNTSDSAGTAPADWDSTTNSWGNNWNQWGWGWSGSGPVDPKMSSDPSMVMPPMMDGYNVPPDTAAPVPSYTTGPVPAPTFQHGYWTASQSDQSSRSGSVNRDRRSKSRNRDKPSRTRPPRDKAPVLPVPPVIDPVSLPTPLPTTTIDAAKRRQLPAWIREGLEKMEREKQKALEREQEKMAREEAEKEKKRLDEEELEKMKAAAAGGEPVAPPKSKFETDSEEEGSDKNDEAPSTVTAVPQEPPEKTRAPSEDRPPLVRKSKEEIMQEVMLAVRRSLTEILLEVTDQEIHTVSQEELARYTAAQASRLNAMKASKSKALAAITSGLGLAAYESSTDESGDEDEQKDLTDQQLQDIIKRKRQEFERTARDIEAEVRRAELREAADDTATPVSDTPERPMRSSATPPPLDGDTPDKLQERRSSKDKRGYHRSSDKIDGMKKQNGTPERPKKPHKSESPATKISVKTNNKEISSSTSSDSEEDSSSSSSSSETEPEVKIDNKHGKKRRRKSSSSSDSRRKSKRPKKDKSHKDEKVSFSKSKHYEDYDRSEKIRPKKKDDYYEKPKSSRSRDYERSHKDKYRDENDEDRQRKRSKRSRSVSYESRSGRRRSRDRSNERSRRRDKESSKRDRSYDKHDRYERYREHDRRRSRSGSYTRHRR